MKVLGYLIKYSLCKTSAGDQTRSASMVVFRNNGARSEEKNVDASVWRNGWMEREREANCALSGGRRRVRWRRGGRTISAGTGAQDGRRSAGYRSTLPFFLHNDAEAHAERQVSKRKAARLHNSTRVRDKQTRLNYKKKEKHR